MKRLLIMMIIALNLMTPSPLRAQTAIGGDVQVFTDMSLIESLTNAVLNYATSAAGSILVEIQDASGQALPGFGLDDCQAVIGDAIERQVRWKNKPVISYVNRMIGTASNGNVTPVVSVPFGMIQMGGDTRLSGSGYNYNDSVILGISHVHKSRGGCNDFLDISFMPAANLAYKNGADGMSLFNFVYYRMGLGNDLPIMEPPFHVLSKLTDRTFLAQQPQYYMLSQTSYHAQIPKIVKKEKSELFNIDVALPIIKRDKSRYRNGTIPPYSSRLRIHTEKPLDAEHKLHAAINNTNLSSTNNTIRILGNPFDEMISPKGHRYAWDVPLEILKNGNNAIEIKVNSGSEINIVYLDLGIEQL